MSWRKDRGADLQETEDHAHPETEEIDHVVIQMKENLEDRLEVATKISQRAVEDDQGKEGRAIYWKTR